jgi:hypothetical protein
MDFLIDVLLSQVFWFVLLGAFTLVVLIVFVVRQKRKLGKGPMPRVEALNATGTRLLFFRKRDDGTYRATIWVIVMSLPIVPLATWRVFPLGVSTRQTGRSNVTSYGVSFYGHEPMGLGQVALMYCEILFHLAVMFGPVALAITLLAAGPQWASSYAGLLIALIPVTTIGGFCYGGFLLWRYNRRFGKGLP